ncbi:hypothetical protein [Flavobacterium selenitireducens]|uniref:hypothetical protein n=1 Tax=Flavobacterium selenitireducens TaxID=2722704 RepID=UPI00168B4837|nr:hypothetical protein [Flavobacterium selenitireducens]MBD3583579.1 hypothetical protein [Flavobacterium selenitireducens]
MNKKAIIAGVAIGVAALTAAGIIAYRNRSKKAKIKGTVEDYSDKFRSKLNKLEKKAKKEYAQIVGDGEDFANKAKERASQWANKAGANL